MPSVHKERDSAVEADAPNLTESGAKFMALADVSAERAVVAGLYLYGYDIYIELTGLISSKTFTLDSNQYIFRCLQHVLENNNTAVPDLPLVLSAAHSLGFTEWVSQAAEIAHMRAVFSFPVEMDNVLFFAHKIKKLEIARQTSEILTLAKNELEACTGEETIDAILGIPEAKLNDYTVSLASATQSGPKLIGDGMLEYVKYLASNPGAMVGISTGFPNFDRDIGHGLRPGCTLVGAFKKTGKSQLSNAIALNISKRGIPVLLLDTEMSASELSNRMLGSVGSVLVDRVEDGSFALDPVAKKKMWEAVKTIETLPYHYCSVVGLEFAEIISIIKRWVHKTVGIDAATGHSNPCTIVLDYLKILNSADVSKHVQEFARLGYMMMDLNAVAIKFRLPILTFVQLNQEGLISQSARLGWYCLSYSTLSQLSPEEQAEIPMGCLHYTHKLAVEFSRFGRGSYSNWSYMMAEYEYGRISEGLSRSEAIRKANQTGFDYE